MMLKNNIKIILVGLFSLLFLGLVYILFGSKPEIISDDSLRIEEPLVPSIEVQVERASEASNPQSISASEAQLGASLESDIVGKSVSGVDGADYSNDLQVSTAVQQDESPLPESEPAESKDSDAAVVSSKEVAVSSQATERKIPAHILNSVNPFKNDNSMQPSQVDSSDKGVVADDGFLVFDRTDDSKIIKSVAPDLSKQDGLEGGVIAVPDSSDFIDLNLDDVQSSVSDTVLLEGEQLVVDDINKSLSKLKTVESDLSKEDMPDTEVSMTDVSTSDNNEEFVATKAGEDSVAQTFPFKPSVFVMPKVDPELMQGNSEMSRKYRETMNKIISINAKLRDADAENADLQVQFEMAVDQNRQLAQIIRDIDTQIKALTLTN